MLVADMLEPLGNLWDFSAVFCDEDKDIESSLKMFFSQKQCLDAQVM